MTTHTTPDGRTLIHRRLYDKHQSWKFDRIIDVDGKKVSVEIVRNAYDEQSYGRVSFWTGSEWAVVLSEPIEALDCARYSYVMPFAEVNGTEWDDDADRMEAKARAVIG